MNDLGAQEWLKDKRLARLFAIIEKENGVARVAGGAVRNGLWGLPVGDIDVATTLLPNVMMSAAKRAGFSVYPTGIDHGTVTVVIDGLSVEVTTLRADKVTDGRHAVVAFSQDWSVDAARRDFTFNALYCDLEGNVYDETGQGLADHEARRVRFVGNAEQRVCEDYLRILRYFRFVAQYGKGDFDKEALAACVKFKERIKTLSTERIQAELFKILAAENSVSTIVKMIHIKVLSEVIKVSCDIESFQRLVSLQNNLRIGSDVIPRLAMLTSSVDHLRLSKVLMRRFENVQNRTVLDPQSTEQQRRAVLYEIGARAFRDAVITNWARGNAGVENNEWRELYKLPEHWPVPDFPVKGRDLITAGFEPGMEMGKVLEQLERSWIESGFLSTRDMLLAQAVVPKNN